ncbi:unnamed protein product [Paramecium sonneborni]|uniref:DUF541 domain-containing protein n=1 Tax=Paramecium sonneborni TaxID=65129 RepID=A0A8S1MGU7_9CILI|nr:unnamed protein product [Paramecium sonneborni]
MLFLILSLSTILAKSIKANQLAQIENQTNLKHGGDHHHKFKINVPGTGIVQLEPSIGTVIFAIEIQDENASVALDRANTLVTKAVDDIKYNLFQEDYTIQTGIFQLSLRYDYTTGVQQLIGYSVTNQLYVTTKNLKLIGKIITVGVNAGLNRIDGVNYSNNQEELVNANDEAIKLAIQDAQRKANKIAESLNLKFAQILHFKYLDTYNNPTTDAYSPKVAQGMSTKESGIPTPIFAAKNNVRVDIELKVLLK